jgi:hypothetical protein
MPERVIEPSGFREAVPEGRPRRDPLFYNEYVGAFLAEVPDRERGRVLRLVEREADDWSRRLSPAQRAWVSAGRRRRYRGTIAAAEAIVASLRG